MIINNTTGSDGSLATYQPTTVPEQELGKEDFLRLLATQLSYQNPLEPVADTEFISQLAEFSALEQMQNANANLETIALLASSLNNALATTLVGKEVKVTGNAAHLSAEGQASISYALAGPAKVTVKIFDANDRLVRILEAGSQLKGENKIIWDGKDETGAEMKEGDYRYQIEATDEDGNSVATASYTIGRVSGIRFTGGTAMLVVNGREVSLADILEILA